jgi:hypothetical protein
MRKRSMDSTTNARADLASSKDEFIVSAYKDIAKRVWNSRLIKPELNDDLKGIDYWSSAGAIQFKELKSDISRSFYNSDSWPFETAAKNKNGKWAGGWVYHTNADYLVFIRTIRDTKEWKADVYNWKEMRPYILANIDESYTNRFGSARNQKFTKEELNEYLIKEITN